VRRRLCVEWQPRPLPLTLRPEPIRPSPSHSERRGQLRRSQAPGAV